MSLVIHHFIDKPMSVEAEDDNAIGSIVLWGNKTFYNMTNDLRKLNSIQVIHVAVFSEKRHINSKAASRRCAYLKSC